MASDSLYDWLLENARGTRHEHIVDLFVMVEREMTAFDELRDSVERLKSLHDESVPPPRGLVEVEDELETRRRDVLLFNAIFGVNESPFGRFLLENQARFRSDNRGQLPRGAGPCRRHSLRGECTGE